MRRLLIIALLTLAACAPTAPSPEQERAIGASASAYYLDAINTNDAARILDVTTRDVVLMPPHEPVFAGRARVKAWAGAYFENYAVRWERTAEEFAIVGDVAYERYRYHIFDTARGSGVRFEDAGKGLAVYRRGDDGKWRLARDAWNSDNPIAAE